MSLRQLSCRGSSLLSHSGSAVGRAGFRGSAATSYPRHPQQLFLRPPAPPCWSSRRPPSWPPCSRPAASQLPSARAVYHQGFSPTCCPRGLRSVFTSAGRLMEQAYRGPPHKRRKSTEDKDRTKEGAAGSNSNTEADRHPHPNHRLKHGGPADSGGTRPGRNAFKEKSSGKSVERKRVGGVEEGGGGTRGSSHQGAGGAGGLQVEDPSHTHTSRCAGQEPQRSRTHFQPQHLQRGRAAGEPPPPGTSPPVTHLEAQPVQCKVTVEGSLHHTLHSN